MPVVLKSNHGGRSQHVVLRSGQVARVGRSEWLELSIPEDMQLDEEHFLIDLRNAPTILGCNAAMVYLAGEPRTTLPLTENVSFIAGSTEFEVTLTGQDASLDAVPPSTPKLSPPIPQPSSDAWRDVDLGPFEIGPTAAESLRNRDSATDAVRGLLDKGDLQIAIKFVAAILPHPACVTWTLECSSASTEPDVTEQAAIHHAADATARKLIATWTADPTEENRESVERHNSTLASPIDWLKQAVVWTGGSLTSQSETVLPPPSHLCPLACCTALQIASTRTNGKTPAESLRDFILLALPHVERCYGLIPANNITERS